MSSTLSADTGWAHLMRWYVTGGDAARLGRDATTALVVLSAYADLSTGEIDGLGVTEIAAKGHLPRKATMVALADLVQAGYAERLDDQARGRRAIWRLCHRTAITSTTGEQVGVASWSYVPLAERQRHLQLEAALQAGQAGAAPDVTITIHQHVTLVQQTVEGGSIGVINVGGHHAADSDLLGHAVALLAVASASERMMWHREAVARGAPVGSTIQAKKAALAVWAGWIAVDICREARR